MKLVRKEKKNEPFFLDTSGVIKIHHQKKVQTNSQNIYPKYQKNYFSLQSDITRLEFHSALLKKHRMKEINQRDLLEVFQLYDKDFQKFNVISVDNFIKNIAMQLLDNLGLKYSLSTLDSLQLATAIFSSNYSKSNYFISSDKKLLNIAKEFFQIINPEEL